MKKLLYVLSVFVFCVSIQHIVHSESDAPRLSPDCLEKSKMREDKYVENIMKDIISTCHLNFDENSFWEVIKKPKFSFFMLRNYAFYIKISLTL